MISALTLLLVSSPGWQSPVPEGEALFRRRIAPILETRCLRCHDDETREAQLSFQLDVRPPGLVEPGDPDSSLLMELVSGEQPAMPKSSAPLSMQERAAVRAWIEAGAPWIAGVIRSPRWWSLEPLGQPPLPELPAPHRAWVRQPLDAFVLEALLARGLEPSPQAEPRTLLRRLHFDLTGLPPEPERVQSFLADRSIDAYEREVELLLASPRYAERWARHWLDVVHYADTHGYDKDKPRPNAWPYRDYVIRALDQDMPWSRFVREQIAGDQLEPGALVATGMLAAGPWDHVGHVELREGTLDKLKTRNLDRDDMVTTVCSSFLSLTVHCARCHDHKFDPIEQREYYGLQAVFAGVERADREYEPDPSVGARRRELTRERSALVRSLDSAEGQLEHRLAEDERPRVAALRTLREQVLAELRPPDRTRALGYHSAIEPRAEVAKWVQLDLGGERPIERVIVHPCDEVFRGHPGPGFGLPPTLELWLRGEGEGDWQAAGVWRQAQAGERHGDQPIRFELADEPDARCLQLRVPVLWERSDDFCFALAEVEVVSGGENAALSASVSAADSIEAGERWGARFLIDGLSPWTPELARAEELERRWLEARSELETAAERERRQSGRARAQALERALGELPPPARVYAVATDFEPEGAFRPPPDGAPRAIHRLERGELTQPRELCGPGAIAALGHAPSTFSHPDGAPLAEEGSRRLALAEWIAHPENPLSWRSIVNRVWHYHFGRGLVGTPNDFGRMGEPPSHPELLDHLAVRFRDQGGSLKELHRRIVTSATYRQASKRRPEGDAVDVQNRLLWRANRRRLEAEALRDAVLSASGNLRLSGGGPGYRSFLFEDDHSPRYRHEEADLEDADSFRRSVYRFVVRSVPDPWMEAFDCADPSSGTAARSETTTPLQALSLLNNGFMLRQAERFAERLRAEVGVDERVTRAVQLAWQRVPTPEERRLLERHADAHGLEAVCRVLFNSNEFLYID